MKLLSERLKWAMSEESKRQGREIRPADLARAANSSATSVNYWLTDTNGIGASKARLLGEYLHVDALWLETGDGQAEPAPAPTQKAAAPAHQYEDPFITPAAHIRIGDEPETVPVRLVKLRLQAGVTRFETEPDLEDGGVLHVPAEVIEEDKLVPHELLAIRVRGRSMEPLMFEDDVIVVDTRQKSPVHRELYALNFDGDCCVKQLIKRNGDWYLHSLNDEFGDVNARSGQISIIGQVVYQPGRRLRGRL
ncbi:S24 family peptidase [Massilia sp. HP4]|uniref:S24 family peptidase n=1 Tax=Massilia sp. HP4 TaxID=2562316 RepID=UPI0010BFA0AF|nr:S24 family peptidase [Massilia sp. HP4]